MQQLIAYAKSQPGKVSIGHGGNGTAMHLSTALFTQMTDLKMIEVPYRGSGPAAMDTLSGQIQLSVTDLAAALPHIKAGKLKAFAVTSPKRLNNLPDVPTLSESGIKVNTTSTVGIFGPAGMPPDIVQPLTKAIMSIASTQEYRDKLSVYGVTPKPGTPAELTEILTDEYRQFASLVKASGYVPE
jgi:tripartite-type tricarboxylate transporter receptor subunit TctC